MPAANLPGHVPNICLREPQGIPKSWATSISQAAGVPQIFQIVLMRSLALQIPTYCLSGLEQVLLRIAPAALCKVLIHFPWNGHNWLLGPEVFQKIRSCCGTFSVTRTYPCLYWGILLLRRRYGVVPANRRESKAQTMPLRSTPWQQMRRRLWVSSS